MTVKRRFALGCASAASIVIGTFLLGIWCGYEIGHSHGQVAALEWCQETLR